MGVYSYFVQILYIYDTKNKVDEFLNHKVWFNVKELLIHKVLRISPPIYIFLDSIDDDYEHAPAYWQKCQKGLFIAVYKMLSVNIIREKLHIIVNIRDTVRAFNSCLNAGVLRAYISLVLAVSNQALTQKSASPRVTQSENPRYTFRTWLIRIGLNGQEFKNCRKHLLSHLEGNIAWLHQEDAIAQRERLKQERIAAREQRVEPVSEVQELNENVPDENSEPTESECGDFVEYEEDEEMGMEMSM